MMFYMLLQLLRLGVNLKGFPSSVVPATFAALFHSGIAAILLLYALFWLKVSCCCPSLTNHLFPRLISYWLASLPRNSLISSRLWRLLGSLVCFWSLWVIGPSPTLHPHLQSWNLLETVLENLLHGGLSSKGHRFQFCRLQLSWGDQFQSSENVTNRSLASAQHQSVISSYLCFKK